MLRGANVNNGAAYLLSRIIPIILIIPRFRSDYIAVLKNVF